MRLQLGLLLLLSGLATGPNGASAQAVTVKLMTERSPFTEPVADQPWRGEATRFTEAVLQRAGIGYELQYLPWRRAYRYVSSEPGVLIYPLARSEPREQSFHWVGQLIPVNYYLFRLKSRDDIRVDSLADARAYRVGVVNYHVHHEYLSSLGFENLQAVNSNVQNLRKALLGRIDLFPISDGGLRPICLQYAIDCSSFEPVLKLEGMSGGLYLAYSMDTDSSTVERTREAYRELVEQGLHSRLFAERLREIERFNEAWPGAWATESE